MSASRPINQPLSGTIECLDPATGEALGTAPIMDQDAVNAVVARGRAEQPAWAEASFKVRRQVLRTVLDTILERQAEICELAVRDSGKTMVDAALGEVWPVCEKLKYTIQNGARDLEPEKRPSGFLTHKAARVEYLPLGVIGVIAPWNFPFHNMFCPTIPALFAGNAVVIKVSEQTSWSAGPYVDIFQSALEAHGFSRDLVQVVTGYGETGAALVRSGVDKIFFTGSPGNGRKVMATASEGLTPVVLELGGKDPMIVCDDADLDHATNQALFGAFTACGQMCVGVERVYVFDAIYDRFLETVLDKAKALRQGPPMAGEPVDLGAMTMPRQLDIIEGLLEDATSKGARIVLGGARGEGPGDFFEPTVLVDVDHTMRIAKEEQFGPVMVIVRVSGEEEAIRLANDSDYGLGSSVFTKDKARGDRMARAIRSGMTVVNDYGIAYMIQSLPFGGVGISGFGRINGREGLRACTNVKAIVTDRLPMGKGVSVYPVQETTFALVEETVTMLYGKGMTTKAKALGRTAAAFYAEVQRRRKR